jgi:hypothetical protein
MPRKLIGEQYEESLSEGAVSHVYRRDGEDSADDNSHLGSFPLDGPVRVPSRELKRDLDVTMDKALEREVKSLYVALTRATRRVLIFDQGEPVAAPGKPECDWPRTAVFEYFERQRLVEDATAESLQKFPQGSSVMDWRAQGNSLFEQKRFDAAATAFRNAKAAKLVAASLGFRALQKLAESDVIPVETLEAEKMRRQQAFLLAARYFLSSYASPCFIYAARCFHEAGLVDLSSRLLASLPASMWPREKRDAKGVKEGDALWDEVLLLSGLRLRQ